MNNPLTVQYAMEKLLEIFFHNLPANTLTYISTVATIGIVGALVSVFFGIFTSRKTSAKVIILVIIITVSAVFLVNEYFDARLILKVHLQIWGCHKCG